MTNDITSRAHFPVTFRHLFSTVGSHRNYFWFGFVKIRPLRSVLTISEPWDEGDRFE